MNEKKKLYKVLVGGASCHGGDLRWSLPKREGETWMPGEWHEVEGDLERCSNGLHLTSDPARWWKPNCEIFLVEAEDFDGDEDEDAKVVARRVRLLRQLSDEELIDLRIFRSGQHQATGDKAYVASGSASVRASGSASVRASGSASVRASDSASVEASDSASVEAWDSASVRASGSEIGRASCRERV